MEMIKIIEIIGLGFFLTGIPSMFKTLMSFRDRKRFIEWLDLMSCIKCNVFWITLITTQDFWWASVASMIAYLVDRYLISSPMEL